MLLGDDGGEVFIGKEIAHSRNYGEDVAGTIDREVKRIMDTSYSEAIRLLNDNIDALHATAKALVEKEKITGEEFREILKDPKGAMELLKAEADEAKGVKLEKESQNPEAVSLEKKDGDNDGAAAEEKAPLEETEFSEADAMQETSDDGKTDNAEIQNEDNGKDLP